MNDVYTEAIKEALALSPSEQVLLETIEVFHPDVNFTSNTAQICFCIDDTISMDSAINTLKTAIPAAVTALVAEYDEVEFALWTFKDEDAVVNLTPSGWVTQSAFEDLLDAIVVRGGGDTPEAGNHCIKRAASETSWNYAASNVRAIYVVTEADTHERGSTAAQAAAAVGIAQAHMILNGRLAAWEVSTYQTALDAGIEHEVINSIDTTEVTNALVAFLQENKTVSGTPPIYLVNDRQDHTLRLEDATDVLFTACSFTLDLPPTGEQGLQEMALRIGNVDRMVSDYINLIKDANTPVEITYRPYLSTDPLTPQMNPPLTLFLTDVVINDFEVSGRAGFVDIVNRKFLTELYNRTRFPSLGG